VSADLIGDPLLTEVLLMLCPIVVGRKVDSAWPLRRACDQAFR